MSQNELALQFYQLGLFNPQVTDQAIMLIDMMDFRGKEELRRKLQQNGTIQETLMQVAQIAMALAEKYEPAVAGQLGGIMQSMMVDTGMAAALPQGGSAQAGLPETDNMAKVEAADTNPNVRKAKAQVNAASRPD